MEKIWFKSQKESNVQLRKILNEWQRALKEYQNLTGGLGYKGPKEHASTERTNFGFFLAGCARLRIPFIIESTMRKTNMGKNKRKVAFKGWPDGRIWIGCKEQIIFEVKRISEDLDKRPSKDIDNKMHKLMGELSRLKPMFPNDEEAKRIGICFVVLKRPKKGAEKSTAASVSKSLSNYLDSLKAVSAVDFLGVYQSPEKIFKDPHNIGQGHISPAVVVIGSEFLGPISVKTSMPYTA